MAFTVARLPGEPIIVINVSLPLNNYLDTIAQIDALVHRVYKEHGGTIYSIVAIGDQDLTFGDFLLFIAEQRQGRPGSLLDVYVQAIVIGTHELLQPGLNRLARELGVHVPLFATVAEGIAHARAQIATASPDSDVDPPST